MQDHELIQALVVNGVGAFALNIVSFSANKKTSPLAMNIGGVTKQVLAIVIGIMLFKTPVTGFSMMGVRWTWLWLWFGGEREKGREMEAAECPVCEVRSVPLCTHRCSVLVLCIIVC